VTPPPACRAGSIARGARHKEVTMVRLQITKNGRSLFSGTYDISDAANCGEAFADMWTKLRQKQFDQETSIGALMDHLDDDVLDLLDGARIRLEKA
jgi:hypothetical protein